MGTRETVAWRDHRTDGRAAFSRIGPWPGSLSKHAQAGARRNSVAGGSPSHRHAGQVWEAARTAVSRSATGTPAPAVIDLAMVSTLGGHLAKYDRCWQTGPLDSATPSAWLTWGIRQRRGLWRIFEPVIAELGVSKRGICSVPTPRLPAWLADEDDEDPDE